jgi:alanine dehydrogenase
MDISIPRERRSDEYRVGLTPAGVELLSVGGHTCYIETNAGLGAGFSDDDYRQAGGCIVYSGEEAYLRAELIIKVARPTLDEIVWMREGQTVMGFLHLASAQRDKLQALLSKKITAIAYETIEQPGGMLPILKVMSQLCGRMLPQIAGTLLQTDRGGKGILLAGVPGVPAAEVVILGGGTLGTDAARAFLGIGASVHVLDHELAHLQRIDETFSGRIVTMVSHTFNIRKVVKFADVLIGAVLVPGMRAPVLVTRDMVRSMRPRSLIMDLSIDQGGCVETSRPTSHSTPTFVEEDIIHYCVPNVTGVIGRTATHTLNNASWPFIQQIARLGLDQALQASPALAAGVNTRDGQVVNQALAQTLETNHTSAR